MRWLVLALCVGCASEWVPIGPMLLEARDNDLAATTKYRSKELRLSGIVVATGEKKMEHGGRRTDGEWTESLAQEADTKYAFVQIRDPEHPSPDVVTCYFTQRDAAAAQLARGATVHLHGLFVEYAIAGGKVEATLRHCSLEP
jgi:hypothetical protein